MPRSTFHFAEKGHDACLIRDTGRFHFLKIGNKEFIGEPVTPAHGEAMGLYNAVQGAGQILGALLGGYLAHAIGYHTTFLMGAMLLAPAMALLSRIKPQPRAKPLEPPSARRQAA